MVIKSLAIGRHCGGSGAHHIIGRIPEFNEDAIRSRIKGDTPIEGDKDRHRAILTCSNTLQDVIANDYACGWVGFTDRDAQRQSG